MKHAGGRALRRIIVVGFACSMSLGACGSGPTKQTIRLKGNERVAPAKPAPAARTLTRVTGGPVLLRVTHAPADPVQHDELRYELVFRLNRSLAGGPDRNWGSYDIRNFGTDSDTSEASRFRPVGSHCFQVRIHGRDEQDVIGMLDEAAVGSRVEVQMSPWSRDAHGRPTLAGPFRRFAPLVTASYRLNRPADWKILRRIGCIARAGTARQTPRDLDDTV